MGCSHSTSLKEKTKVPKTKEKENSSPATVRKFFRKVHVNNVDRSGRLEAPDSAATIRKFFQKVHIRNVGKSGRLKAPDSERILFDFVLCYLEWAEYSDKHHEKFSEDLVKIHRKVEKRKGKQVHHDVLFAIQDSLQYWKKQYENDQKSAISLQAGQAEKGGGEKSKSLGSRRREQSQVLDAVYTPDSKHPIRYSAPGPGHNFIPTPNRTTACRRTVFLWEINFFRWIIDALDTTPSQKIMIRCIISYLEWLTLEGEHRQDRNGSKIFFSKDLRSIYKVFRQETKQLHGDLSQPDYEKYLASTARELKNLVKDIALKKNVKKGFMSKENEKYAKKLIRDVARFLKAGIFPLSKPKTITAASRGQPTRTKAKSLHNEKTKSAYKKQLEAFKASSLEEMKKDLHTKLGIVSREINPRTECSFEEAGGRVKKEIAVLKNDISSMDKELKKLIDLQINIAIFEMNGGKL